jgi:Bacterial RNA polymerase, alpha chain C terminal domain
MCGRDREQALVDQREIVFEDGMTTAEMLAIAVLKGDESAIAPLLDCLLETLPDRERQLLPVKTFKVESNDLRVILFVDRENAHSVLTDWTSIQESIEMWMKGRQAVLPLIGISRIELYEFPRTEIKAIASGRKLSELPNYLDLGVRELNLLEGQGIKFMEQLTKMTWNDLRELRGCGPTTIHKIREWLQSNDLDIADSGRWTVTGRTEARDD